LVRFVFGLNNHFDFSASAAAPKIIHRSPLFHYRSASLVRERLASVATESDAGHTLLPNQKSELAFCGTRKTSHLWRLVENEVYDERLELRRWYLTFAKHNACISEGGPSCRCLHAATRRYQSKCHGQIALPQPRLRSDQGPCRSFRTHCRQWPRNTRYQADATPYLGRTFTGRIAPALPGALIRSPRRRGRVASAGFRGRVCR
jgi:hypothetical protein